MGNVLTFAGRFTFRCVYLSTGALAFHPILVFAPLKLLLILMLVGTLGRRV
jgi:hypothetical protein